MKAARLAALPKDLRARAAAVRLLALDVDGTLTDGRLIYGDDGSEHKAFHVRDGLGLKLLGDAGVALALVSARSSAAVERRARELGIAHLRLACKDKAAALTELAAGLGLELAATAFMGDDLPDLAAMRLAGFAAAPADAHPEVLARAHWSSRLAAGRGAVRELCDLLLLAQDRHDAALAPFLGAAGA